MKKLPIGIQTFDEIIRNDYLYVDKTEQIEKLITMGKYYFLSRPRRFGKSLLISTLKEIFSGNKELFKDLYIYDKIDWITYPVIRLDMSNVISSKGKEFFGESIINMLNIIANEYNIIIENPIDYTDAFRKLIYKLSKINKVVVLVDEYDKPIIDYINNKDIASENRDLLKDLYSVLKSSDEYIKFCFLTGVSKFSKVSVFSGLNNLKDITINERYSTICGITQIELENNFNDRLNYLAIKLAVDKETLKQEIKNWYNGYSWDGTNTVYNPFSLLNFFDDGTFKNYWFSSGTPTFLVNKFIESKYKIEEIKSFNTNNLFFDSYNTDIIDYRPLLFQTGYLTIKHYNVGNNDYIIGYPNKEVKDAFLAFITATFIEKAPDEIGYLNNRLYNALLNNDLNIFFTILKSIIAGIPYQLHIPKEAYYHSLFYLIMELMGIDIDMEVSTSKGRIDGVVEFENNIYILEFKYLTDPKNASKLLHEAINQIKTKKYFEPYLKKSKPVKYLAVVINKDSVEYKLDG
ncbi:MAG: AAA family ATPase [bacterium]